MVSGLPSSRSFPWMLAFLAFIGCTAESADTRTCIPPEDIGGSPHTVEQAVTLLRSLPQPVTLPCLLESLDRPLEVELSSSISSAQPAAGTRSPRIFLFEAALVLSVVPDGPGASVLEFAQFVSGPRSLKAELELPIEAPLADSAPYDHVLADGRTRCGICHRNEQRYDAIDYAQAYVSDAIRPRSLDLVDLDSFREEWRTCDWEAEPDRCAVLQALFGHGPVVHRPFSPTLPTFF